MEEPDANDVDEEVKEIVEHEVPMEVKEQNFVDNEHHEEVIV